MKKKLLIVVGLLIAVLVVGGVAAMAYLGPLIKKGVETVGPLVTKVDVKLDRAQVSLLGGSGRLRGLTVGNPAGYKSPDAIKLGEASLAVVPSSIFGDKIHVTSIAIVAPEITLEGGLKDNNLTKILANVQEFSGPGGTNQATTASSQKKLQVDSIVLSGIKVTAILDVLGDKPISLTLPDIRLTNLGQGPDGITAGELDGPRAGSGPEPVPGVRDGGRDQGRQTNARIRSQRGDQRGIEGCQQGGPGRDGPLQEEAVAAAHVRSRETLAAASC